MERKKNHGGFIRMAALLMLTGSMLTASVWAAHLAERRTGGLRKGVILESVATGAAKIVAGDPNLASRPACPASVFKLVITWAGLETGVLRPDSRIACREDRIASGMCELGLSDALLRSSNRYFEIVAGRLGPERLTKYAARSGLVDGDIPGNWLKEGTNAAVWGGELLVTPARVHDLTVRIAAGILSDPSTDEHLASAIEWPCDIPGMRIYGKSGTMRGAVWFTGFTRETDGRIRTVTVFLMGGLSRKAEAAMLFFNRFGMKPPVLPSLNAIDKQLPAGGK